MASACAADGCAGSATSTSCSAVSTLPTLPTMSRVVVDQLSGHPVPQGAELVLRPRGFRCQHVHRGVGAVVQQGRQ